MLCFGRRSKKKKEPTKRLSDSRIEVCCVILQVRRCFCQDWPEEVEEEQSSGRTPDPDQFSYWSTDHESENAQAEPNEWAKEEWPEAEGVETWPHDASEAKTGEEQQELWRACLVGCFVACWSK